MAIHSRPISNRIIYYTTKEFEEDKDPNGYSIRKQQDEYVFAKKLLDNLGKSMIDNNVGYYYYIRVDGNKISDPRKIFSLPENKISYIDRVCKGEDRWAKVPYSAFESYLKFLQTESDQWYKEAIRNSK